MRLKGKTALITGGNSGIGLATARLFVSEGAQVAITGRDQTTLDAASQELGPNAAAFRSDVGNTAERKHLFREMAQHFGKLDILFANAGVSNLSPLGNTTEEAFQEVIHINLTSVFFTVQSALPLLRDAGSVVLNGSVIATLGQSGYSAYAASKAGIRALSRTLAADLAPRGIRVNVVVPGATSTPIWSRRPDQQAGSDIAKARAERIANRILLGRFGEAEEIAKAVLFLASDDASFISATELVVDGGTTGSPLSGPASRK
ncbi:MAG TPA: SDR family oxidoreductase [Terriglobales bacterium]|jgi:NAD(P)-dependent dehydrogenase (short-subunit alcohol dehydrogenase family)|nr:SDR family oxidoreductase [Terriglobales bacterium]